MMGETLCDGCVVGNTGGVPIITWLSWKCVMDVLWVTQGVCQLSHGYHGNIV